MSRRKKPDATPPTTFKKTPEFEKPVDIGEFVDVYTGRMLVPAAGLILSPDGRPMHKISGLTLNEAMAETVKWWDGTARYAMPDRPNVKGQEYLCEFGVASGIMLGYPWQELAREEKLKVLRAWWLNVGAPKFVGGFGTSQDGQFKGVLQ